MMVTTIGNMERYPAQTKLVWGDIEAVLAAAEEVTISPELYRKLRNGLMEKMPELVENARKSVREAAEELTSRGLEVLAVERDEDAQKHIAVGADASYAPMPIGMGHLAMVASIALREPRKPESAKPSGAVEIMHKKADRMTRREFKFLCQLKGEALIPALSVKQLETNGHEDVVCVLLDGPLSASLILRKVPRRRGLRPDEYRELVSSAHRLIRARDELVKFCHEHGLPVIGVVKRCTSRHFIRWYGLENEVPFTDQFVFHQMLNYGERTNAISITKAIEEKLKAPHFSRYQPIYGFYIKTSRTPITPPVRVEFPAYVLEEWGEDWVATYALSTALTVYEPEFDGLPRAICQAHKRAKVSKRIVSELYKKALTKEVSRGTDPRLLGTRWGFKPGE